MFAHFLLFNIYNMPLNWDLAKIEDWKQLFKEEDAEFGCGVIRGGWAS